MKLRVLFAAFAGSAAAAAFLMPAGAETLPAAGLFGLPFPPGSSAGAAADAALSDVPAEAPADTSPGWFSSQGRHFYRMPDGSLAAGAVEIDGLPYLFAPNGAQQTGWQTVHERRYYYDPATGAPQFGVVEWCGESYYITPEDGKCEGVFHDGDTLRFADKNGALLHGWQMVAGTRCYLSDGLPLTGWQTIDGERYVLLADGSPFTGWTGDGKYLYYFHPDGHMETGWLTWDSTTMLFDADGHMQTGFAERDGSRYYFSEQGYLQTGLLEIDGRTYLTDDSGALLTGMYSFDDAQYCFTEPDGAAAIGWLESDYRTYYFDADGRRVTGWLELDGARFYLDADDLHTGWLELDGDRYFFDPAGILQTGWIEVDGLGYYMLADGRMATGVQYIDGERYRFDAAGQLAPVTICLDAGHYGKYNHSPVVSEYWESDFNWTMHLYLKEALESYGFDVITTRENKAEDLAVYDRGLLAEGCDLFLSLHSNASSRESDDGPLACCPINGCADELGQQLAELVADVMGTRQGGRIYKREGERGDWYGVLRGATAVDVPAVLLEHSFHTNTRATKWLLVDDNIRKMAQAEAEFLARWFGLIPDEE